MSMFHWRIYVIEDDRIEYLSAHPLQIWGTLVYVVSDYLC